MLNQINLSYYYHWTARTIYEEWEWIWKWERIV